MSTTITADLEKIRSMSGECIDNSKPIQIPEAIGVGDMIPQGDIGLLVIDALPEGAKELTWEGQDYQLAPGTNKGSRHCIPAKYRSAVKVFSVQDGDALSDLCLEATESFDVAHPEHADHLGYPPRIYRVVHEQNEQNERVRD